MKLVNFYSKRERGFTLIEIIFVIALLGGLMAILFKSIAGPTAKAKADEARLAMGGPITQGLQMYQIHNHKYPTTEQGLKALVADPGDAKSWSGPYATDAQMVDPWNNPIEYELLDGRNFKLTSRGDDGELGTADDITFPEESKP